MSIFRTSIVFLIVIVSLTCLAGCGESEKLAECETQVAALQAKIADQDKMLAEKDAAIEKTQDSMMSVLLEFTKESEKYKNQIKELEKENAELKKAQ